MKTHERQAPGATPTAMSLFAGTDGCSLGFRQGGCDVQFVTDFNVDAVESYRRNLPGTSSAGADLR